MRFLLILFMLIACGLEPSKETETVVESPSSPSPGSGSGTIDDAEDWAEVKVIINEQCALSGCHAGAPFLQTGAAFKAKRANETLIANNRMPLRSSRNYGLYTPEKKLLCWLILGLTNLACVGMDATVTRPEWLKCCQVCDRPQELELVTKSYFSKTLKCFCKNGSNFSVEFTSDEYY